MQQHDAYSPVLTEGRCQAKEPSSFLSTDEREKAGGKIFQHDKTSVHRVDQRTGHFQDGWPLLT